MDGLFIWWVDQAACEAIDKLDKRFPNWLRDEFSSRYGRSGRGRLWANKRFDSKVGCAAAFDESTPMAKWLGGDYGGIVIDMDAMHKLVAHKMAGVFTDFNLNIVSPGL